MLSLMSRFVSYRHILEALTSAQTPNEIFTLILYKRNDSASKELTLTWAVSDELEVLAQQTSIFLCDVADAETMQPLLKYLRNIPGVATDLDAHLRGGIVDSPSLIIIEPSQRKLVYAEYKCKVASLPTILMIVYQHTAQGNSSASPIEVGDDYSSYEEDESDEGEDYFDFQNAPPRNFEVYDQPGQRGGPSAQQQREIEAMRRAQERQEIQDEYQQALAADRKAAAEAESQRKAAEAEEERKRAEADRAKRIAAEKEELRTKLLAAAPPSGVRVCLRTRTAEKVIFTVPATESLKTVLQMAYATDKDAMAESQVAVCTTAPRQSFSLQTAELPSVGAVAGACASIAFIVEYDAGAE